MDNEKEGNVISFCQYRKERERETKEGLPSQNSGDGGSMPYSIDNWPFEGDVKYYFKSSVISKRLTFAMAVLSGVLFFTTLNLASLSALDIIFVIMMVLAFLFSVCLNNFYSLENAGLHAIEDVKGAKQLSDKEKTKLVTICAMLSNGLLSSKVNILSITGPLAISVLLFTVTQLAKVMVGGSLETQTTVELFIWLIALALISIKLLDTRHKVKELTLDIKYNIESRVEYFRSNKNRGCRE